ncbi:MAG: N-acetylmuramic acid 6-phosphate etherase [Acidobacteria bacterium]|nr:MAG: N-acetylmuramic acid 6-phosphate etherase [Acidobacteriota bacterium]
MLGESLITEQLNPRTTNIDELPVIDILRLMNEEDQRVARAVEKELPRIAAAVEAIVERLRRGGRLFYVGAGTSGRLGVLDAVECPPTFGTPPGMIEAIIAGGPDACWRAVEGAEDDARAGAAAINARSVTAQDAVVGLTASGRTPFTLGALEEARHSGALTIAIACNPRPAIAQFADISITPVVGPEVIAGSTRLKAGTAQKMILNMLSTVTMIQLGYTYGNMMSNLQPRSEKLRHRARAILRARFDLSDEQAARLLDQAGGDVKVALVMKATGTSLAEAQRALTAAQRSVKRAIEKLRRGS